MQTCKVKSYRPPNTTGNRNQRGFTLIEMIVGLAIMALLVSALATGITQAFRAAYFQRTGAVSMDEARRIIPIITKDLQIAKSTSGSVTLNPEIPGAVFTITFEDPEDDTPIELEIIYTLDESNLIRSEDGVDRTIGRHVREVEFSITDPGIVEVTLATWTEKNEATATNNTWTVYQRPSP
ncbi:MAG: prepilin-type N-terminal cleavage/methylation domain-containing protein [Chloroflexi bacterium]|nr:prepilin-type N-terminal cleavage/methylation domain-containing protein [Chloroflexota bacterium]